MSVAGESNIAFKSGRTYARGMAGESNSTYRMGVAGKLSSTYGVDMMGQSNSAYGMGMAGGCGPRRSSTYNTKVNMANQSDSTVPNQADGDKGEREA
jgi:hypothetical protein